VFLVNLVSMSKYDKLPLEYKEFFKKLDRDKPDLLVLGKPIKYKEALDRVKTLSASKEVKNIYKLKPPHGLATRFVKGSNGKSLVSDRIKSNNIVAFFEKFPELDPPEWFDKSVNVDKKIDELLGLHLFNTAVVWNIFPPSGKRANEREKFIEYRDSVFFPNYTT